MHKQDLNRVVKESMDLYGIFIIILVRPIYRLIMHFKEQCTIMNRLLFDLSQDHVVPRQENVWTDMVGLSGIFFELHPLPNTQTAEWLKEICRVTSP